jgi:glycosyltransferase involved in cell wall biosynthesis
MLLHKSVEHDSRVRREARALAADGHDVTVVHLPRERHPAARSMDGFRLVCATPPGRVRRALPFHAYRLLFLVELVRMAVAARPDVVHAHDAPMLAPGLVATRLSGARLVYDSHELATGVPYRERSWARLVAGLERVALPRCAAVITVSDGIADRLGELYGLRIRPVVLRNVPDLEVARNGGGLRERLGIGNAPLVLHQGAPAPGRGCEALTEAISSIPGAHLVFLGDPWPGYGETLDGLTRRLGVADRVHLVSSVPLGELLGYTREADVGVSLLQDGPENHRLALPNKVFEYVAAGVPVVVSDLPELSRLVREHGIGWTADPANPASVANVLREALARGSERTVALEHAAGALSWEREKDRLLDVYKRLRAAPYSTSAP